MSSPTASAENPMPAKATGSSAFGWNMAYVHLIDGCDLEEAGPG